MSNLTVIHFGGQALYLADEVDKRIAELEAERDRLRDEIRQLGERYARETDGLRKSFNVLVETVAEGEMLKPPAPIIINKAALADTEGE